MKVTDGSVVNQRVTQGHGNVLYCNELRMHSRAVCWTRTNKNGYANSGSGPNAA